MGQQEEEQMRGADPSTVATGHYHAETADERTSQGVHALSKIPPQFHQPPPQPAHGAAASQPATRLILRKDCCRRAVDAYIERRWRDAHVVRSSAPEVDKEAPGVRRHAIVVAGR